MKVNHLEIASFRGINHLSFEFDSNEPVVIVGVNGIGKSSVLDCIAVLLSWLTARIQNNRGSGRSFTEKDIKQNHKETYNSISISSVENPKTTWTLSHTRKGRAKDIASNLVELQSFSESIRQKLSQDGGNRLSLPIAVYYSTNRAVFDIPLRIRKKHTFAQIDAYEQALVGKKIEFRTFFEWYRNQEDIENQQYRDFPQASDNEDWELKAVRKAIYALLGDDFSQLQVQRKPCLQMIISKQGEKLSIDQLSDGEKCLLALVGDLARRLAIANPSLDNPLQGEGIVLIDEIELHLHPMWQRKIILVLQTTFPRCQFIVTTHSPQVISHVKWVYLLKKKDEDIFVEKLRSYGKDSNRILEEIMGDSERPLEIKYDLLQLFRLIDQGNLPAAKEFQKSLEGKIDNDEPEFARADVLIRRREILGR